MPTNSVVELLIKSHERELGEFVVRRVLPALQQRSVGPFIFWDHMGPVVHTAGQGMDVRPHPHIGLATVTYLFEGEIFHRDSLGNAQVIRPGDINWMTAGRGIVHSERTPDELRATGQRIHGIQSWFALPSAYEDTEPGFWHHPASTLPVIDAPGLRVRVLLGRFLGETSPVACYGDTLYAAIEMDNAAQFDVAADHIERAVYVLDGQVDINGQTVSATEMAVLKEGQVARVCAQSDSRLMLLGGDPLDGPRHLWWNFVATTQERIEVAKARWRNLEFPPVPGETEYIPLPER